MLQLQPLETFTIARQLGDPLDSTTYYVRAVIRNAKTDAVIATLGLDNKGSGRFRKDWQVVQDSTGQGLYITITTTVYIDAGYTTSSPNHFVEEQTYLIQARPRWNLGGGGTSIDYERIRKMINDAIKGIAIPETDTSPLVKMLAKLQDSLADLEEAISGIEMNPRVEIKESDLGPIRRSVEEQGERVLKGIRDLPVTDLRPVTILLRSVVEKIDKLASGIEALSEIGGFSKKDKDEMREMLTQVIRAVSQIPTALFERGGEIKMPASPGNQLKDRAARLLGT
ncbi:MAG: hypothetical protein FJW69_07445 [Actinobacteria bacterium]|nr:hypothetical protein [Actinomycetota bacterium]